MDVQFSNDQEPIKQVASTPPLLSFPQATASIQFLAEAS